MGAAEGRGSGKLRVGEADFGLRFHLLTAVLGLLPIMAQIEFHDGEALREGDVVVLQLRDDHGEPEEHEQKDGARDEQQAIGE